MNNLNQSPLKVYDYNIPHSTNKSIFWDNFGSLSTPKYRNIPISKTIDSIKVTGIPIKHVSGFKELESVSNFNRNNQSTKASSSSFNTPSKRPKHSPNVVATKPPNTHQHQTDPAPPLLERQSSWSEPALTTTKGSGDSIVIQDVSEEEINTFKDDSKRCFGDEKPLLPKNRIVKGLLYIKNAGVIYKSEIEAKKLQIYERDIFKNFPRFRDLSRRSTSKNLSDKNTQMKPIIADERDDFDIAIYLSGLVSAVQTHQTQNVQDVERTQREECKHQDKRTMKSKRLRVNKGNAPYDRSYQMADQSHTSPTKLQRAKKCDPSTSSRFKSRLTYQINKQNVALDLPGDDSDEEYELNESGTIVSKRKTQETLDNDSSDVKHAMKPSRSGRLSCKSRISGTSAVSSRTRIVSQSSVSRYSDGYGFHKPKINEEEMWENFQMIFKSYASTSRHSGEVIPRKISTEWMINAGVVNGIMTQKQADDAFRSASGTKVTMNAQDYKEFLISLSLKLKLSYYEIYRRMCGM